MAVFGNWNFQMRRIASLRRNNRMKLKREAITNGGSGRGDVNTIMTSNYLCLIVGILANKNVFTPIIWDCNDEICVLMCVRTIFKRCLHNSSCSLLQHPRLKRSSFASVVDWNDSIIERLKWLMRTDIIWKFQFLNVTPDRHVATKYFNHLSQSSR